MVSKQNKDKCLKLIPKLQFTEEVKVYKNGDKDITYAELHDDFFFIKEVESIVEVMKILNCDLEFVSWYDLDRSIMFTKTIKND